MAEEREYGGFWARFVALVIDNAVVFVVLLVAAFGMGMVAGVLGMEAMAGIIGFVALTVVPLLYWPVLESSKWQATVGKRLMGLEVTDLEGNRLSFVHALLRALAKIISSIPLGLGFLIAAFTARKQALHDIIVKTLVVRSGPSQLWKIILALIIGLAVLAASAAALFYFILMPMFSGGMEDKMKDAMKGAPQVKTIPSPAPAAKAPQPQAKPAAPASQAAMPAGKAGPDPEFDAIAGKPLEGLQKPNSTRAGPAILELSAMFSSSTMLGVNMPVPSLSDAALMPDPTITIDRVLDAGGKDYYDADSSFEKGSMFRRVSLNLSSTPVPHLTGTRSVQLKPGLSEQTLQKIEGQLRITVPVDPKSATLNAKETDKETTLHGSTVSLQSVSGNAAKLRYRGASEHLLLVRGYGADGKPLALDSRQILPEREDVDSSLTITFKGPPAKLEVTVAAKVIERAFPFSLARGAVAGPPSAATGGITMPARVSKVPAAAPAAPASAAPATAAPATAAAVAAPAPAPKPAPVVAAPAKQAAAPAKSEPKPRAEPKARPAPVPAQAAAAPRAKPGPRFNDVMTAVLYRDAAGVNELLDMGRWVDRRDSAGLTPLMVAVRLRDAQMSQLLIRRGADVNATAVAGESPLAIARKNRDAAMVELLQKSGAR